MIRSCFPAIAVLLCVSSACGQNLETRLQGESAASLVSAAQQSGNPQQGAILFHQVHIGCIKCHAVDGSRNALGPDLTKRVDVADNWRQHIVTSILKPSDSIRKGYETVSVVTTDGRTRTGLLVTKTDAGVTLRDPASGDRLLVPTADLDEVVNSQVSVMPAGIVNQMTGRQQFLDLVRYVLELQTGGTEAARKLQPPPGLVAFRLPEYEQRVDHAGLVQKLDKDAFQRGKQIYDRLCVNCHGTKDRPGSLPTALRFGEGKFKHGGDPHTMYKTLTHGFGLMVPQTWMVPKQKYDVVHYIREKYVRSLNADQYVAVTDDYLASLPTGDTFGPEPVEYAPWSDMDYGPTMVNTFEIGSDGSNFAFKGIASRLDPGPGGIARGKQWMVFDHDTLRLAAAWVRPEGSRTSGFINWQGIHFDGRHGKHPRISGDVQLANPTGPGWARPGTDSFADTARVTGRDGRRYGPLPTDWAQYRGLYAAGPHSVVAYTVGDMSVLEHHRADELSADNATDSKPATVFSRTVNLGPTQSSQQMLVATVPKDDTLTPLSQTLAVIRPSGSQPIATTQFGGRSWLQIDNGQPFDMTQSDFTITARIRARGDGTIFSKGPKTGPWIPNGKTFFIRDGRLCYDIGWVGAVRSKRRVDDDQWHDVGLSWNRKSGVATFYIDGEKRGSGTLRPADVTKDLVARIGYTTDNFPGKSAFEGDITSVSFWGRELTPEQLAENAGQPVSHWDLKSATEGKIAGSGRQPAIARVVSGDAVSTAPQAMLVGVLGDQRGELIRNGERVCLQLNAAPADRDLVVWTASVPADLSNERLNELADQVADRVDVVDLPRLIERSTAPRWPQEITTAPVVGPDQGPFAVDVLSTPAANPWLARVRL
ncbi:MAG: c-type cytochrome, partial [Planctomycetaceae bacterium]|nr:c-type cytochrome [Planctomycetaceae bacterium]